MAKLKRIHTENDKFFSLAEKAFRWMRRSYKYNDTMFDKDELINVCWLTGHWRRYLDKTDCWITSVMKYDMIQYLRKKSRPPRRGTVDRISEPLEDLIQRDLIRDLLFGLKKINRMMLLLHCLCDYTYKEIAEIFGTDERAVYWILKRSKEHIRESGKICA